MAFSKLKFSSLTLTQGECEHLLMLTDQYQHLSTHASPGITGKLSHEQL